MIVKPEIIYEDADLILCRKPAGVATQTKRLGQQDMESILKNYRAAKGETPYIGVIHRLDQPVEGMMVFAKNPKAAAQLSEQVQKHMIGKHYYALTGNCPVDKKGSLENYLVTDKKTNYTTVTDKNGAGARYAKLEYEVMEAQEGYLWDILLHTGRQHQIRVQLAEAGCPIQGDEKYAKCRGTANGRMQLCLCSYRLEFIHPTTGKRMDYSLLPTWKKDNMP